MQRLGSPHFVNERVSDGIAGEDSQAFWKMQQHITQAGVDMCLDPDDCRETQVFRETFQKMTLISRRIGGTKNKTR